MEDDEGRDSMFFFFHFKIKYILFLFCLQATVLAPFAPVLVKRERFHMMDQTVISYLVDTMLITNLYLSQRTVLAMIVVGQRTRDVAIKSIVSRNKFVLAITTLTFVPPHLRSSFLSPRTRMKMTCPWRVKKTLPRKPAIVRVP